MMTSVGSARSADAILISPIVLLTIGESPEIVKIRPRQHGWRQRNATFGTEYIYIRAHLWHEAAASLAELMHSDAYLTNFYVRRNLVFSQDEQATVEKADLNRKWRRTLVIAVLATLKSDVRFRGRSCLPVTPAWTKHNGKNCLRRVGSCEVY
jgi:hypothetical protein